MTIPIVAIAMVVIVGAVALTADLGNGWRVRRALIPASDAAALAAAQEEVNGANGCTNGTAADYVDFNETLATMTLCDPHTYPSGEQGRVSVTVEQTLNTWFAAVLGINQYNVSSTSTAVWGPPAAVTGLRPIGLCMDSHPDLADAVNNPPTPPATETIVTVTYGKSQPSACGNTIPGNWGIINFDGGQNGQPTINEWIRDGYPGAVEFGNHVVTSCTGEPHCREGNPGSVNNSYRPALDSLIASGIYFTLPVFNYAESQGANAEFHLNAVVRVRLISYQLNGNQANRSFTFGVKPGLITGTCCGGGSGASGNKVITICGVDPNQFAACDP